MKRFCSFYSLVAIVLMGIVYSNAQPTSTLGYSATPQAFFSPGGGITRKLLTLIKQSTCSIHAAVYLLTDKDIAQALIEASKRGVIVRIVLDTFSATGQFGKALMLANTNVETYLFQPKKQKQARTWHIWEQDPIMHHKFAIFDDLIVWLGSFNWTVAADTKNCESVLVLADAQLASCFEQEFACLIAKSTRITQAPETTKTVLQRSQYSASRRSLKTRHQQRQTNTFVDANRYMAQP